MSPERAGILLVDDRPENLLALEAVLEPLDQHLVRATSGEEALKRVLNEDFAVILLDVQMPGLDGFETAELIKQRERSRHIPIIFLTAISKDSNHALRGYSVGAVDYLFKPFDPLVLRSKVQVFIDLYYLKRQAELLAHRALHDSVTGLPNRALFLDRLEMALARVKRRSTQVAVLFIDLDGFKLVNDNLGHDAGDKVLVLMAERLQNILRPSDTVARFGGDEFTVLSDGISSERDVFDIADRVSEAINEPFTLDEGGVRLSASIGIALAGALDATRPEALLREADVAMYRAKQYGGSRHELFNGAMRTRAARRLEIEQALRQALDRGEFRLQYQPKIRLDTGEVIGVEALLRWEHPQRGLLAPFEFIGPAEETGLIVPIGAWVLGEACRQGKLWREKAVGAPPLMMAVNLSARQLAQPDLVEVVARQLDDTQTDPKQLCLEITESVAMEDAGSTIAALSDLKSLGVSIAIDDFGTGYSSLGYLRRFPVDVLKIDRSFVEGLGCDAQSNSIAKAVISLGHALGLSVTAEGVETLEQLNELRALDCDVAQGYYLSVPQDPRHLSEVVETRIIQRAAPAALDGPTGDGLQAISEAAS